MRKIRPEAMAEAVQLATEEACSWLTDWHLHEQAVPLRELGQLRALGHAK